MPGRRRDARPGDAAAARPGPGVPAGAGAGAGRRSGDAAAGGAAGQAGRRRQAWARGPGVRAAPGRADRQRRRSHGLPAPNPGGPPGAAGPALVVGDSIALGSADSLRRALGAGSTVDAKVGRQFSAAPGIVAAWAAVNHGPIVVDLGANGTVSADDVEAVIAAAGDRRVVLVGVHVPRRWQDGNNAVLRAAAAAHPSVAFVDWDALASTPPSTRRARARRRAPRPGGRAACWPTPLARPPAGPDLLHDHRFGAFCGCRAPTGDHGRGGA